MRLDRAAAVLGDAEVFEAKRLRGLRHFLKGIVTVARGGVTMESAAQIFFLDQARQRMIGRRFKFAAIFAQLRRNKIEIEGAIKFHFIANLRNPGGRSFFARTRRGGRGCEAIFVQRPTAFERAIPQLDVVLLAAGEIIKGKGIFGRADHAQVALNLGAKSHARFGRALRDDRFNQWMLEKKFRDRSRLLGCDDQIEIAHNFSAPAIAASDARMQGVGMGREIVSERFRLARDLAKLKRAKMFRPIRDRMTNFSLRRFSKTRQFRDAAGLARFLQLRDRADVKFLIKSLDLFRAETGNGEQFQNGCGKVCAQFLQIF